MLDFLEKQSNEKIKSFRIARAIGVCVSDTNTTARMLNYLTHFGKISLGSKGDYSLEYKNNEQPSLKGFRFNYIENLAEILKFLSEQESSIEELSQSLNREVSSIETELKFLEIITSKGRVFLDGNKYVPSIYLVSWGEKKA